MEKQPIRKPEGEKRSEKLRLPSVEFVKFIRKMFPGIAHTGFPHVIEKICTDIKPLCQLNPLEVAYQEQAHLVIRGSSIKRYQLGTPAGYWKISPLFQNIPLKAEEETPLIRKVLEKISIGPRDLDIMYDLVRDKDTRNLLSAVNTSLIDQGYTPKCIDGNSNQVYFFEKNNKRWLKKTQERVKVEYYQKAVDTSHPIHIIKISFFKENRFVLKVDLVPIPNGGDNNNDFRFSGYSPWLEISATAGLASEKGRSQLIMTKDLREINNSYARIRVLYKSAKITNNLFACLRNIGNIIFWPSNKPGQYSLKKILRDISFVCPPLSPDPVFRNGINPEPEEIKKVGERLPDIISETLVYLTQDPFLFLLLAFRLRYYDYLPLGNQTSHLLADYILNPLSLYGIVYKMAKELNFPVINMSIDNFIENIQTLSELYQRYKKKNGFNFSRAGPMMLVRAINEIWNLSDPLPESLTGIISLINPLPPNIPSPTPSPAAASTPTGETAAAEATRMAGS